MDNGKIFLCDYVVAFIDLLGQKNEMLDRYLPENNEEAIELVKKSVGRIIATQKNFQSFYDSFITTENLYSSFPPDIQAKLPDLAPGKIKWQRFSDGFVIFAPLGKELSQSPANSIFSILFASGLLCLINLAGKSPLRIGIDVGWAVEYRPGELYGSAIAHSYTLESELAQWPRIVVGDGLIDYLQHYVNSENNDLSSQYRRKMAQVCLSIIINDIDDTKIINYLGQEFNRYTKEHLTLDIIDKAQEYIESQVQHWNDKDNIKLLNRYQKLLLYFKRNKHEHI